MTPATEQLGAFELQLKSNHRWAMSEASEFFEGKGAVQRALRAIASRLDELEIPYAVVGGMALFAHGYERFTSDVDLLVSPESLTKIHERLDGLGYVPPFAGSKHLRDATNKVKIEFLTTGGFPGDGKPKPVSFPDPRGNSVEIDGVHYLSLPQLINLKLASGMSSAHRLKDLADVQELAKVLKLTPDFSARLNPYVRDKFVELVAVPPDTHGRD